MTASTPNAGYRADIDGIRALAVVPVVLNHLGVPGFWGGYVGVDIFFVISGYLITGHILDDVQAGRFAIATFYRRRILRILPALFTMLLACTVAAIVVMLPTELMRYARSLGAAALSGSNLLFYTETGYFGPAAKLKPLLHTWSLAIEEQFYLVWPLILLPVARHHPARVPWLAAAFVALPLAVSAWWVTIDSSAAYYLLPSRAWELAVGAWLASCRARVLPRAWAEALAPAGLGAILFAIKTFTEATPFPGFAALLPCLGTAALIAAGSTGSATSRLLALPPCVFVGRISYSLYLWHWPVIVFASIGLFAPHTAPAMAAELVLSVLLAAASTRWIERPFRQGTSHVSTRVVLRAGVVVTLAGVAVAGGLIAAQGLPGRFTPAQRDIARYEGMDGDALYRRDRCFVVDPRRPFDAATCLPPRAGKPVLLLIGDSHAAHYWPGLSQQTGAFTIGQATHTGCRPVLSPRPETPCQAFMQALLSRGVAGYRPDLLLLSGRWQQGDLVALAQTLENPAVRAAHPVVLGPVPQYVTGLPRLMVFGPMSGHRERLAGALDPAVPAIDHALAALTRRLGVPYVSMLARLCPAGSCIVEPRPGVPLQFDYGHFTREGSETAVMLLAPDLRRLSRKEARP